MSPLSLRRYRAERLLAKEFTGLRSRVLAIVRSKLRSSGVTLGVADLEGCYAQAWNGLYTAVLEGEEVHDAAAWLVVVTFRRALDEARSAMRRAPIDIEQRSVAINPDLAGRLDDRRKLRHLLEALRGRLSERECQAASLCYVQGLSRAQAAARMGISEARMRKLMDGASPSRPGVAGKVGELIDTIRAGEWCEQQASLMRAFAFGILDPEGERYALASAHQRECPACRAYVLSLRGLAAVLPPLWIPLAPHGGNGVAARMPSSVGRGWSARAGVGARVGGSRLGGSFALKLAAGGLLMLGGGYAVFGGVMHGGASHRPLSPSQLAVANEPPQGPFTAHGRYPRARSHSSTHRAQSVSSKRSSRLPGSTAREFGPERTALAAPLPAALRSSPGRRQGRTSREFGFE